MVLVFLVCIIAILPANAQVASPQRAIDSLSSLIGSLPQNQSRLEVLIALCKAHWDNGDAEEEIIGYVQEVQELSSRLGDVRGKAYALSGLARHSERRNNEKFTRYAFDSYERFAEGADFYGRGLAERNLAAHHFYMADYTLSIRYYEQALKHFEECGSLPQTAWMLYALAIVYGYQGNYIVSLSDQFKALRIFEQLHITHGIAASNQDLGFALLQIGSTTKAMEYLAKAQAVYEGLGKPYQERLAGILNNLASAEQRQGNLPEAISLLGQSLAYTASATSTQGILARSTAFDVMGAIARKQDNKSLAAEYYQKAFQILDSTGVHGNDRNYATYRLALLEFNAAHFPEAERLFHEMLERSLQSNDKRNTTRAMLWLGKTMLEERKTADAVRYGREAFASAESIGQLEFATSAAELLSAVFEQTGKASESLTFAKIARKYRDSIATLERTQQLAGMEAMYNLDRERVQLENLRRDNEIQLLAAQRLRWLLVGGALALCVMIGFAIALARLNIRRKRANEKLERQTERIRAISRIGAEIASNLVLKDAIVVIYGHVNQLMDAPIFNIGDYLPDENCIQMRFLIEDGEFVAPPRVSMDDSQRPAVRCVKERIPIVLNDVDIPILVGKKPESLVYVPLISGEKVIGVFSVQSLKKHSYPQDNVDLLIAISAYIATALENARAFARIKEQQVELEKQASFIQLANVTLSERNLVLENLNAKVRENIAYAETIQRAVLPPESELQEHLGNHVIFYKPMEVISGDFYWMQRVEFSTLVAVVDCTGHGIPGAFMSMIGNDLLNQIVLEKGTTNPSWILTELHYAVRRALKQTNDLESNQDGMDVCLCRIDKEGITFAGARRSLYIVQSGEILELEGDTKPIGGFQRESKRTFSSKRIDFDRTAPTMLYLTSDGYADQHNAKREKFGTKRLEALFRHIAHEDMTTQHSIIAKAMSEHQGATPQRDDMTILGVQITV